MYIQKGDKKLANTETRWFCSLLKILQLPHKVWEYHVVNSWILWILLMFLLLLHQSYQVKWIKESQKYQFHKFHWWWDIAGKWSSIFLLDYKPDKVNMKRRLKVYASYTEQPGTEDFKYPKYCVCEEMYDLDQFSNIAIVERNKIL